MGIQENMAVHQVAVQQAQEALNMAIKQVAIDQAALDAIQPHVSLWQEVNAMASNMSGGVADDLRAVVARAYALLGV